MKLLKKSKPCLGSRAKQVFLRFDTKFTVHKGKVQGSRVAFQTHPRSQASSRGEANDSTLLSSRDGYLLEPTEWPTGSQASCGFWSQ